MQHKSERRDWNRDRDRVRFDRDRLAPGPAFRGVGRSNPPRERPVMPGPPGMDRDRRRDGPVPRTPLWLRPPEHDTRGILAHHPADPFPRQRITMLSAYSSRPAVNSPQTLRISVQDEYSDISDADEPSSSPSLAKDSLKRPLSPSQSATNESQKHSKKDREFSTFFHLKFDKTR